MSERTNGPLHVLLLAAVLVGCGGGSGNGDGGDGGVVESAVVLFPLALGAEWEYLNTDSLGVETTLVKHILDACEDVSFEDCVDGSAREHTTYVQESTGAADPDEAGQTFLEVTDGGIVRVRQEIFVAAALTQSQTYTPYFMRLFDGPWDEGRMETFEHERCEFDATDALVSQTHRRYRHEVLGREEVTVPAGTYDAVLIERTDLLDGDRKHYWYARDVGKVREEEFPAGGTQGSREELVSFTAGDGSCG